MVCHEQLTRKLEWNFFSPLLVGKCRRFFENVPISVSTIKFLSLLLSLCALVSLGCARLSFLEAINLSFWEHQAVDFEWTGCVKGMWEFKCIWVIISLKTHFQQPCKEFSPIYLYELRTVALDMVIFSYHKFLLVFFFYHRIFFLLVQIWLYIPHSNSPCSYV